MTGMVFRSGQHQPKKKKKSSANCDLPGCDCDGPGCCDLGLFSFLLTLGSVTAKATRAPVVDRAGRVAILGYRRWLSHRWPGQCRFTPTCSRYGLTVVERHGLAVGGRMAADRLRRCRPEVPLGSYDPPR